MTKPTKEQVALLRKAVREGGQRFSSADKTYEPLREAGLIECYDCIWGRYYYELTAAGRKLVFR